MAKRSNHGRQVSPELLFHYLPQLETYGNIKLPLHTGYAHHLSHLIRYLKNHFDSTIKSLEPLLEHGEITFGLLWALFCPNALLYTICDGTGESRCLRFKSGEEKMVRGEKYYFLNCHYLDYDGKIFGQASTTLEIANFHGARRISTLNIFPLQHHREESKVTTQLIQQGKNFMSLIGIHHREYEGTAFFTRKGQLDRSHVKGRIMVDAVSFKEANSNYSKPGINESVLEATIDEDGMLLFTDPNSDTVSSSIKSDYPRVEDMKDTDLLICSHVVMGYSLGDQQWCKMMLAPQSSRPC